MKKVVLLSGGIDSTTCLALERESMKGNEILALNCYYGQKNEREMSSARNIAHYYDVQLMEIDLAHIFSLSDCPMLKRSGREVDHRSYGEQTDETHGKPISSYVPFRNGLMLSAAVTIAYSIGADEVIYGAHADDASGNAYPDCTEDFVNAMSNAAMEGTAGQVRITAPLVNMHKAEVVRAGTKIGAPYELTWSCYEAGDHPCGKCGTCIAIKEAFEANGLKYPVK